MSDDDQQVRKGSCHCGKVTVTVQGKPKSVSICHCTTCQRLNGAPFGIQSMHAPSAFECNVLEEHLWSLKTSKAVTRYRCQACGSPVYASLRHGKAFVVPRSMIFQNCKGGDNMSEPEDGNAYEPTHHMYYGSRIIDVIDDLPKFVGAGQPGGKGVLWTPEMTDSKEPT